jgi:IS30 family transposase
MNEKYHRLFAQDRKVIYNMNKTSISQAEIGQAICFSQATVSKELSRNCGKRGYRPKQANDFAVSRATQKRSRPKVITGVIQVEVDARMLCKHSPDQMSGKLASNDMQVSHETIYRYICEDREAGGNFWTTSFFRSKISLMRLSSSFFQALICVGAMSLSLAIC